MKETDSTYKWTYCSLGGVVRVKIASGEDLAHLGELDQKLWTTLSCPVKGLEFDADTLKMLDKDGDGKIRVNEVVDAATWITSVIRNKDLILNGDAAVPLEQINCENEAGKQLFDSARQILANLGLEKQEISVADTSDSVAIFAKTRFNGDGIITPDSTDDEALKQLIGFCIERIGSQTDRSGAAGVNADTIEKFYAECADFAAWQQQAADAAEKVFPYGDATAGAFAACEALKDKMADFFMRCKLIAFDAEAQKAVDVSAEKIGAISDGNLAGKSDEIAAYPLARPNADGILSFDCINPAWQAAFDAMKGSVLAASPEKTSLNEAEWLAVLAGFADYTAWAGAKKGTLAEPLGLETVRGILADDKKAALLDLVAQDKALEAEANAIAEVNRLTHMYRDLYKFVNNYVTFMDFYNANSDEKAVFEAGRLFIDQRCCKVCIKVEDMGQHADMAGLSGMFLIYCACTSKVKQATMNIVAVMTAGDTSQLRPGKNAVFYDRDGQDWDAVVTRVVENPISIRQAFWSPYRKFANAVSDRINKSAAEKDNKVMADMTAKANNINVPAEGEAKPEPKSPFDIAKFAGIFAAIGLALGYLAAALTKVVGYVGAHWYRFLLIIAAIIICISGPACFIAWQKLRKRNLGPVLNANGWAINAVVLVNILFGATLTSVAKYPKMNVKDPYAKHGMPAWLIVLIILIIAAAVYLWKTGQLPF